MFNDIAPSGKTMLCGTTYLPRAAWRHSLHRSGSQRHAPITATARNVTRQSQRLPATSRANRSDRPQRQAPIAATARNVRHQSQRLSATSGTNRSDCPQCQAPIAATARKTSYRIVQSRRHVICPFIHLQADLFRSFHIYEAFGLE